MAREMKDSGIEWIGEIPANWNITRLCYLIDGYKAGPFGSALIMDRLLDEGEILVYTPENIAESNADLPNNKYLQVERKNEMQQFIVHAGDIIFPIVGSLGRAMYITDNMPTGIINQRLAKFHICSPEIDVDYFLRLFAKSSFYSTYIDLTCRGSIIVNLTKSILHDMPVLLPPISVQKKIAIYLDKKCVEIDTLSSVIQSQIDVLEKYKKSVITEAVTKGLNPDVEMKDSGIEWIGGIPNHWEIDRIKYHLRRNEPRNPGNTIVLSVYREYGVIPKDSRDDNHNVTSEDTSKYKFVRKGNLVINKMKAWQGSLAVSQYEGIVSPAYFIYEFTDDRLNKKYFHYLLRGCYKDEFRRLSGGIREGQWDLSPDEFEKTFILIPPSKEQERISIYLEKKCAEINGAIEKKKEQFEVLMQYKKSLIYEYVTGKKEIIAND